jgi:arylsulfatase A-like enzyme
VISIPAATAGIGLLTGLLELGLTLALEPYYDDAPGFFRGNRHVVWIIPVVNLAIFGAAGLLLGLLVRIRSATTARLASFLPPFLGALTLLLTVRGLHMIAGVILAGGFASRLAPRLGASLQSYRRPIRLGLAGLAVAAACLVAASYGRERFAERAGLAGLPTAPTDAPNVLLIVLDTVRADHLSLYGYARPTSPNLTRLAQRGVRFERARAPAPWTLPSHASMFTGRWPHELSAGLTGPLDATEPTLAESLRRSGYATAGFVANTTYCSAESGLSRGFVHYEDHTLDLRGLLRATALGKRLLDPSLACVQKLAVTFGLGGWIPPGNGKAFKDAAAINADFLSWLSGRPRRPFFAFLNYFDAHHPYLLPEGVNRHFGVRPESHADVLTLHRWWSLDKRRLPPRDLALARDAYDDCIAYLDSQLGRLFDELDRRGILAHTLVIVTSDHGEQLGEHGLFGHASSLYSPEIHVPLVVVGPGGVPSGRCIGEPVSLRDLPATVTDVLGLPAKPSFPGRSLARHWDYAETPGRRTSEPVLSEVDGGAKGPANGGRSPVFRGPMKSLISGDTVYIRGGDGREELYDLATDPHETRNLVGEPGAGSALERFREDLRRLLWREPGPRLSQTGD